MWLQHVLPVCGKPYNSAYKNEVADPSQEQVILTYLVSRNVKLVKNSPNCITLEVEEESKVFKFVSWYRFWSIFIQQIENRPRVAIDEVFLFVVLLKIEYRHASLRTSNYISLFHLKISTKSYDIYVHSRKILFILKWMSDLHVEVFKPFVGIQANASI